MSKARVAVFSVSLDGFKAGPRQDINNPLGVRGFELHPCFQGTEAFRKMHGHSGGTQGIDNHFASKSFANLGVWILGRNMFGPVRGAWRGDSWKGWWGDNPPYHTPVFVLTHYGRPPLEMEGGTTFHFVTDGIESAHGKAIAAANEKDVGIGGGVSTIRQYWRPDRRTAFGSVAGAAWRRRIALGRNQSLPAGLQRRQERSRRKRDPHPDRGVSLVSACSPRDADHTLCLRAMISESIDFARCNSFLRDADRLCPARLM